MLANLSYRVGTLVEVYDHLTHGFNVLKVFKLREMISGIDSRVAGHAYAHTQALEDLFSVYGQHTFSVAAS